ncbi:MAG: hypothetical protein FJ096_19645 [Deltaproteobacteria bacterium]|nr:hypothetical protein [Deltaproteobacteria bacterium]
MTTTRAIVSARGLAALGLSLVAVSALAGEAAPPVDVSVTKPKLLGGTVSALADALDKTRDGVAGCVAAHGGLGGESGRLEVQFLVRDRGRAEGVEVMRVQRVSPEAAQCVQRFLKNRLIGSPSDDPVGVVFAYKLKRK